ncbi:MAG: hypothetical protein Q9187_007681 [Circinaria calcarea]
MSCPTANRWFVPDEEYYYLTGDYVFVHKSANAIQALGHRYGMPKGYPMEYKTFYEYMRYAPRWFLQATYGRGALIYTDVNRAKPEHKAAVYDLEAQKPWLEEGEKETEGAREGLMTFARDSLFHLSVGVEEWTDSDLMAEIIGYIQKMGVSDILVEYIIKLKDTKAKTETLRILSGQKLHRKPRPVMILIKMFGNMDHNGGWVVAYDFIQNVIVIKSFESKDGEHPLDEAWYEKPPRDDIYHSTSPHDFAKTLVLEFASEAPEHRTGFSLAVSYQAGKWIRKHEQELEVPEELSVDLQKALDCMKLELKKEVFPNPEILEPPRRNVVQMEWVAQRDRLLQDEDDYRDLAIEAKEDGFETSANNLAKYFERSVNELAQFVKDPEIPLEI